MFVIRKRLYAHPVDLIEINPFTALSKVVED